MNPRLSPETVKLLEERMKRCGYATADDVVRAGLASLDQQDAVGEFDPGELDELLAEAESEFGRGEGIPAEEVFAEIRRMSEDYRARAEGNGGGNGGGTAGDDSAPR